MCLICQNGERNVPSERDPDPSWARLALLVAAPLTIAGFLATGVAAAVAPNLPVWAQLALGTIPIHIVGTGAVALTARAAVTTGRRLDALGLSLPPARNFARALRHLLVLCPLAMLLTALSRLLLEQTGYEPGLSPMVRWLLEESGWPFWSVILFLALVLAPFTEELLFRVTLHDALLVWGKRPAAWLTAVLFALIHQIPEQIPALLLLSLALQQIRRRSEGSILPAMAVHAGFNGVSVLLVVLVRLSGAV